MNDCHSGNGVQKPAYSPASSKLLKKPYFPRPLVAEPLLWPADDDALLLLDAVLLLSPEVLPELEPNMEAAGPPDEGRGARLETPP